MERLLQPWVELLILPLCGFASVGVPLAGLDAGMLVAPVTLGVGLGLLLGKPLGVLSAVHLAIRLKIGNKPQGASFATLSGVAVLCGIGFTISLFISGLAFSDDQMVSEAKIGIFTGCLLSAVAGWLWLRRLPQPSS
jgi:NhaA family Na+:H+ antiporter